MSKKQLKISMIFNFTIVALAILGTVMMLTGFEFMGKNMQLTATRAEAFKFFTVDSNLLACVSALILGVCEARAVRRGDSAPKAWALKLKLAATAAVTLTMLVTAFFFGLLVENFFSLYVNANFFFHFLIPVLCILSFTAFERTPLLKARDALYGLLPTLLYAIYYGINLFSHAEGQTVSPRYDWYYFVQGGLNWIWLVAPLILLVTYLVSLALWAANHKKQK